MSGEILIIPRTQLDLGIDTRPRSALDDELAIKEGEAARAFFSQNGAALNNCCVRGEGVKEENIIATSADELSSSALIKKIVFIALTLLGILFYSQQYDLIFDTFIRKSNDSSLYLILDRFLKSYF